VTRLFDLQRNIPTSATGNISDDSFSPGRRKRQTIRVAGHGKIGWQHHRHLEQVRSPLSTGRHDSPCHLRCVLLDVVCGTSAGKLNRWCPPTFRGMKLPVAAYSAEVATSAMKAGGYGYAAKENHSVEYAPKTDTSEQDLFVNSPVPRGSQEVIYGCHSHDDAQWNVSFPFQNP